MIININNINEVRNSIPNIYVYNNTTIHNYQMLTQEEHFAHGWRDVVIPNFDSETQYLGEYELINDVVTKQVIDYTIEQLEQQIQNKKSEYLNKLVNLVNKLDKRILISSVSKEENDIEYLKNQTENRYYQKYKVAKKYVDTLGLYTPILEDEDWYNQIIAELENTNTIQNQNIPLSIFMTLIVQYYELGDFRNMKFQTTLETFRAKTKDYILMLNFVKAEECMELAETLPDAMSLTDLDNKIIELNGI